MWTVREVCVAFPTVDARVSYRHTKGETRVRFGWRPNGESLLTVHLGPTETTDGPGAEECAKGRLFKAIVLMGAELRPSDVPSGELGVYRQPIGAKFLASADELIAKWRKNVKPQDPNAQRKAKVKKAQVQVKVWARRSKLAQTKSKLWNRRLKAALRALQKAMEV